MSVEKEHSKKKKASHHHQKEKKVFFLFTFVEYLKASFLELRKVSWASRRDVVFASFAVLIVVFIVGLFLGTVDVIISAIVRYLRAI